MAKRSEAFFVISNFNYDPMIIAGYSKDYVILDQSNDPKIVSYLQGLQNPKIRFTKHVGHNLVDYLDWIIENWNSMPKLIAFVKGNTIGRHIDLQHWLRIYENCHYTFVYNNDALETQKEIQFDQWTSDFHEVNNSWFASLSHHRYFTSTNQLIDFLYARPRHPPYLTFSPGGCYIVESSRILNKPLAFWLGLREILKYEFFPSEAWMVERLLHTIFFSEQELQPYVFDAETFLNEIEKLPDRSSEKIAGRSKYITFFLRVKWKIKKIMDTFLR